MQNLKYHTGANMSARIILIIEDDDDLRSALVEQLSIYDEFDTFDANTAISGLELAEKKQIDLVIMDIGLPDMDGREAIQVLRSREFKAPIILLTGHDSESDTVLGLESGANDYVTKPFKFSVLLARIRAQMRQYEQSEVATYSIGKYIFHPAQKTLKEKDGKLVRLTEKEAAILKYMFRAGNNIVSRKELLEKVWGYHSDVATHTLETHIYRLRQKIEPDPSKATMLISKDGGYRLTVN